MTAIDIFLSYSAEEKEEFIAHLMYELTLIGRDSYGAGPDGLADPQRMRRINEVQHRVSAYLWALLRNDQRHYPDDVLLRIILEQPDDDVLEQQLNDAFARLIAQRRMPVA